MPYTEQTLATMSTLLAEALGDPDKRFWPQGELESLLRESLRTWNIFTGYWRERRQFPTTAADFIYDLTTVPLVPPAATTVLELGDAGRILNDVMFGLMEPFRDFTAFPDLQNFPTSGQFTSLAIYHAYRQALAQFHFDTGMVTLKQPDLPVPPPPTFQLDLPENVCDVRRVGIRTPSNVRVNLRRQDEYETQHRNNPDDLLGLGATFAYSFLLAGQPGLRLFFAPGTTGAVEVLTTRSDALPPRDLGWSVKWLTLFYLLSQDGQSRDPVRASYCWKRYKDSQILATLLPSYMIGYVNGRPVPFSAISDEDSWNPAWANNTPGLPQSILSVSWNLIALSPRPDGVYSVLVDGIVQAPIPEATPIQLAPEHLSAILDYARHTAMFKVGGVEFAGTQGLYERFVDSALEYNGKLLAESKNLTLMQERAARDKEMRRVRREPLTSEGGAQ